ncbi:unnamed protein product [Urochloa decumbens]|uniref:LOB domain-containing protein n=1 Tax=Urochloa decumbens TaxID=240449 RepID=A0ABC9G7Q6_9POAL
MSTSSNPHLRLHVDTTTTSSNTHGSAASPGSGSSSHSSRSPASSGAGGGPGPGGGQNQSQACAACKYQRRKCNPDCPLAPYFPADQQRRFLNAHRLFGVSKIQKTLQRIDPERVPDAMRTLVFQSDARAADPVGGCVAIIENLQKQIARAELELAYVNHQIAIYRQAAAAADPLAGGPAADMMILPAAGAATAAAGQDNVVSLGALYAAAGGQEPVLTPAGGGLVFHGQNHHPPPQQLYNYFCYGDGAAAGDEATSSDGSVQQQYGFAGDAAASVVKMNGSPAALGEQLEQQCRVEAAAFVDAFDVKPRAAMQPPLAVGRHGPAAGGLMHRREEKLGAGLKKHGDADDIDQHMEEPAEITTAAAAPPCQLELGFSSSF